MVGEAAQSAAASCLPIAACCASRCSPSHPVCTYSFAPLSPLVVAVPRGLEHAMLFATLCEGALHGAGSSVLHLCHAGHAPAPHVLCSATMLHSQSCHESPGQWECKE